MAEAKSKHQMFIDGKWTDSSDGKSIPVYDPTTGTIVQEIPSATKQDVLAAVEAAKTAFIKGPWGRLPPADRSNSLLKLPRRMMNGATKFESMEA